MSKFKQGDRVRVYSTLVEKAILAEGQVVEVEKTRLTVNLVTRRQVFARPKQIFVHPKQCRKLVKKERLRIWVSPYGCDNMSPCYSRHPVDGFIEFVAVGHNK